MEREGREREERGGGGEGGGKGRGEGGGSGKGEELIGRGGEGKLLSPFDLSSKNQHL